MLPASTPPSARLVRLSGVPLDTSAADLWALCEGVGSVASMQLSFERAAGGGAAASGAAAVTFASAEDAEGAAELLDSYPLGGALLSAALETGWTAVKPKAKPKPRREPESPAAPAAAAPVEPALSGACGGGLWIGNLRWNATPGSLRNVLQTFGPLRDVHMAHASEINRYNGTHDQWAVVKFGDAAATLNARQCLDGAVVDALCSIPLKVRPYTNRAIC